MLESLEDLLESGGYTALTFASAAALLEAGLVGLDVVVADIGMPGMDGFQLRDAARQARPDLPIFLITGRHELMDDERVAGADGLFRKPFDAQALLAAVEDVVRGRRKGDRG